MEEKILGIISKHYQYPGGNLETAKEITTHVMEFIEWKDDNTCYDDIYTIYSLNTTCGTYCIKTLYQYWLTNIKKS